MSNEAKDDAAEWYNDLRANSIRQVDASMVDLETRYNSLAQQYTDTEKRQEEWIDDNRTVLETERELVRLKAEAQEVSNAYATLQNERQRLEQHQDPRFEELLNNSSAPSQMFLRVHRHKLSDPAKLRQLLHADARCRAVGLKPDSRQYFSALEAAVGLSADDRSLDDFKGEFDESTNTYRQERATSRDKAKDKPEIQATEAQKVMARNLPGVDEQDYLKACAQPFSQASQTVSLEPDELNFGDNSKGLEVSLDEAPKKPAVDVSRYKPGPSSVTLNPTEKDLCVNMATTTGRPVNEVLKEFAKQKLALHSGKSSHMLYEDRLKAMGQR